MTAFNDSTQGLLSQLFFVKQLKAMQEFFALACEQVRTLQGMLLSCIVPSIQKPAQTGYSGRKHASIQ